MKLYHGSYCSIETIDLQLCGAHTDFGKGFYLTPNRKHAVKRALQKAAEAGTKPVISAYEFNEEALTDASLKIKTFKGNTSEWAEFILKNREYPAFTHDYDIVAGPIADDALRKQFARFKAGIISVYELSEGLTFREDTFQYCFCTKASLKYLKKI